MRGTCFTVLAHCSDDIVGTLYLYQYSDLYFRPTPTAVLDEEVISYFVIIIHRELHHCICVIAVFLEKSGTLENNPYNIRSIYILYSPINTKNCPLTETSDKNSYKTWIFP